MYAGKIADKPVREQAQRLIYVSRKNGVEYEAFVWVVDPDNTASAHDVAAELKVECVRCGAHVIALGPRMLFYPVKRVVDGTGRLSIHKGADEECYTAVAKVRKEHKHVRTTDQPA